MRISGSILDRLLYLYLPAFAIYWSIFLLIPDKDLSDTTPIERNYIFLGVTFLLILRDSIRFYLKKIRTLKIDNGIMLSNEHLAIEDIKSISFIRYGNTFDIIKLSIQQNGQDKEASIMDKPKMLGIFGTKGSKTLSHLYFSFPDLQQKEIKNYR